MSDTWGVSDVDVDDATAAERAYMDRLARYVDDADDVCYRASALGLCDKALAAFGLGHQAAAPPEHMQHVYDQGHALEDMVLSGGLGAIVDGERERQVRLKLPVVKVAGGMRYVTCTLDELVAGAMWRDGLGALTTVTETGFLIREAKAFGDANWGKWKRAPGLATLASEFPYYATQLSVQMYAVEYEYGIMPALEFIVGLKGVDAAGQDTIVGWDSTVFTQPPVDMKVLKLKIMRVEKIIAGGVLPDECVMTYPCPMYYLHGEGGGAGKGKGKGKKPTGKTPTPEHVTDELLDSLCAEWVTVDAEYAALGVDMRKLETRRRALQEGIKGWFDAHGKKGAGVRTDGFVMEDRVEWREAGVIKAHERRTVKIERVEKDA